MKSLHQLSAAPMAVRVLAVVLCGLALVIMLPGLAGRNVVASSVLHAIQPSSSQPEMFGWLTSGFAVDTARLMRSAALLDTFEGVLPPKALARWRAVLSFMLDDPDTARSLFDAADTQDAGHPMLMKFEMLNWERIAQRALAADNLALVIDSMRQSDQFARLNGYRHSKLYADFCMNWYRQGRYRAAKLACQRLLEIKPTKDIELLNGVLNIRTGDYESAQAQLDQLARQYPDWDEPRRWLKELDNYRQAPDLKK
jgi:tetratricopeptide (TPR) repeat protein